MEQLAPKRNVELEFGWRSGSRGSLCLILAGVVVVVVRPDTMPAPFPIARTLRTISLVWVGQNPVGRGFLPTIYPQFSRFGGCNTRMPL